jgi:eukaryotic-like serine/threonine-protein kinase
MASQQKSVEEMVEAGLALPPEERKPFLEELGRSAPELKCQVEQLLLDHQRAGSLPEEPRNRFPGESSGETETVDACPTRGATSLRGQAGRFKPGETLSERFTIVRFIARGGMGEVYEVQDRFLQGVHVALKIILPHIADDPTAEHRFEQEVLLARQVTHPNLCPIYDIFHCEQPAPKFSFLTMKLLSGETLAARFAARQALPRDEAELALTQMMAGLAAIHAAGIVHRDIKPNNVMLHGSGARLHLWITDFGLARMYEAEATMLTRGLAGTPGYIAPEMLLGQPPTQASDIYALGVVLHQVFTGEKPVLKAGSHSVSPSPRLRSGDVPSFAAQLVTEFLADDPKRRCHAFAQARGVLERPGAHSLAAHSTPQFWTRRRFIGAALAAAGVAAGGTRWKWEQLKERLYPLPTKRFVALLTWPPSSNAHVKAMLAGVIDAIEGELSRAEAFDRNLFVISPPRVKELSTPVEISEVRDSLGANLVLAASGVPYAKGLRFSLQVLDPSSTRSLREKQISCAAGQEMSLPDKAVRAAAELLNVSEHPRKTPPPKPATQSVEAYAAFQQAESLRKQENDTGLDESIENYKRAVELDPRYAMAYARLAQAYGRFHALHPDSAALIVARRNYEAALALMPDLVEAHLAKAFVLEQTGEETAALHSLSKALSIDPSNARILLEQAVIYGRLNRWADAERTYDRVLKQRPNYWLAYNELGATYDAQGKFREALDAFRTSSLAAPKSNLAFNNIASIYLVLGNAAEAAENARKSLDLKQNALAAATMAATLRFQHKYAEALLFGIQAAKLDPSDCTNWIELGDCHSSLRGHRKEAANAYFQGAQVQEAELQTDATNGPSWILLGLCRAKSNAPGAALAALKKAETLPADDLESQLYKARALEAMEMRGEALATLRRCFKRGATDFQVQLMPDMGSLRADPRYQEMARASLPLTQPSA